MLKTLQKRFITTSMIAITVLLVVLLGVINGINIWMISRETDEMLTILANSRISQGWSFSGEYAGRRNIWGRPFTQDEMMSAVFFVVRFGDDGEINYVDVSRISSVTEEEAETLARVAYHKKGSGTVDQFKYTSTAVNSNDGTIYVFLDTSSEYLSMVRIAVLSFVMGIICWVLMLLLVICLSKKAIHPIAENIQKQRQFVTDAGHELKTPLAIILANTDAMELHNGESKWSKNIRSQVIRLNGLMQNLLTLARTGEDRQVMGTEPFDLSDLTGTAIASFEAPMQTKQLVLQKDICDHAVIHANQEQISSLLSILLDNAVKYSPTGGTIMIRLTDHGRQAELYVENSCEALPPCAPEQLFDRFYRADMARTQKNGGYGIGLSAARTIVESYHGTIEARYFPENRIAFIICLQK